MKGIALAPLLFARIVPLRTVAGKVIRVSVWIVRIVMVMRVIRLEGPPGVAIQIGEPNQQSQ
jgi:hypothetical protein